MDRFPGWTTQDDTMADAPIDPSDAFRDACGRADAEADAVYGLLLDDAVSNRKDVTADDAAAMQRIAADLAKVRAALDAMRKGG